MEYLVSYDSLTSVLNRHSFKIILKKEISRCKRYNKQMSLIIFDIDHFKIINDTFGHTIGDRALIELSNLVEKQLRESDYYFRIGGEEFVVIIPGLNINSSKELTERLRIHISKNHFTKINQITASFGITEYRNNDNSETILKRANKALYKAKESNRNKSICLI